MGDVKRWDLDKDAESAPRFVVDASDYDALRADLASVTTTMLAIREQRDQYSAELAALKEAAGKVTCFRCSGMGYEVVTDYISAQTGKRQTKRVPCPDCADLRKRLGEKHE
jgi:hypothetical protein